MRGQESEIGDVSLRNIFLVFIKIGAFAFGGVYSMLAFFERELVDKRKWLSHDEYVESVAIGQMTPGPPIINTGICIGYNLRRLKGALVTTLGQSFPGTVLAILLAVLYIKTKGNVLIGSIMKGIGAAVVGLLLSIVYKMAKEVIKDYKAALFALTAFFALSIFKLNPIGLILAAGLIGFITYRKRQ